MMHRGSKYWIWADCELHCWSHNERMSEGTIVDIQARVSRKGETQVFIGVYDKSGWLVLEESHDYLPNHEVATALSWGVSRARAIAAGNLVMNAQAAVDYFAYSDFQRTSAP